MRTSEQIGPRYREMFVAIGKAIRAVRKKRGLNQQSFSTKLGVSQAQISRLESGMQGLRFVVLMRVARILGVKASDLLRVAGL